MKITLCTSCALGQTDFATPFRLALTAARIAADVAETECMSACTRPSAIAFRSPGKTAYLFGDLTKADLPDLITFAQAYAASPDGTLPDTRPLGVLRHKAIARIPA